MNVYSLMEDLRYDGPTLDHVPEWYSEQKAYCHHCEWKADQSQIFRNDGKTGDGELIDGPITTCCPTCGKILSGKVRLCFLDPGVIFVWDERPE